MSLVLVSALLYLGGGALYSMQQGNAFRIPHVRFWNNVYSLVLDGIHFVFSGGKPAPASGGTVGYTPVPVIVGPKATVSGDTTCVLHARFLQFMCLCSCCYHPNQHSRAWSAWCDAMQLRVFQGC